MSKFIINGGKTLTGEIKIYGSKNACLPLMAACLLTDEECVITNVPEIADMYTMIDILKDLGASVEYSNHKLTIKADNINKSNPNQQLVSRMRGSLLIIGALLARMHKAVMPSPGGDKIGARQIDTHINALKLLGVRVSGNGELTFEADKLVGSKIILEESSVTATENVMLTAVLALGKTIIKLAAMEPHVQQLGEFLNLMGAKISGIGSPTLVIEGVDKLHGATIELIADGEQAASFITLAAATKSAVTIDGINPDALDDFLLKLRQMNVNFEVGERYVKVLTPNAAYKASKIQAGLYPKLNSDFIPPMSVLATQADGDSIMHEWMYENRQGYVESLIKMGANAKVLDKDRVLITGPTPLHGDKITTYDIRMGMTLVIAALVANGQSEISDIHHIDRGYEDLESRLQALGADIKRID